MKLSPRDSKLTPSLSIAAQIALLIISCVVSELITTSNSEVRLYWLCWLNNIVFVIEFIIIHQVAVTIQHPVLMFDVIIFLFCSGQCILYSFGVESVGYNVFTRVSEESAIASLQFAIPCYIVFCIGSQIAVYANSKEGLKKATISKDWLYESTRTWALVLLIIGILPFTIMLVNTARVFFTAGYKAYYSGANVRISNSVGFFSYYFYVSLFILATSKEKTSKYLSTIALTLIAFTYFMCGDRGTAISLLLAIILLYGISGSKEKTSFVTLLVIVLSMSSVSVISDWRHSTGLGFFSVAVESLTNNNIIVSTLSNLGGTFFTLVKIMELFPSMQPFLLGKSYLASFVLLIPSRLSIGPLSAIRSSTLLASPSAWLMRTLSMSYGPGFIPFAEAYMNFGYFGIIAMGILGYFFAWTMTYKYFSESTALTQSFQYLSFFLFAMAARGSINYVIAFFFRYILLPYILIRYTGRPKLNRARNAYVDDKS